MNSNLAEVGKPTRWPPGQSGNPAGKPPGTRTAFSQGFIRDFALVWAEEGLEAVRKVSRPIAARCSISACARGAARLFSRQPTPQGDAVFRPAREAAVRRLPPFYRSIMARTLAPRAS